MQWIHKQFLKISPPPNLNENYIVSTVLAKKMGATWKKDKQLHGRKAPFHFIQQLYQCSWRRPRSGHWKAPSSQCWAVWLQKTLLGLEQSSQALQSSKSFSCHTDKFEGNLSSAIAQTRKIHYEPPKKETMLCVSIQISFDSWGMSAFP